VPHELLATWLKASEAVGSVWGRFYIFISCGVDFTYLSVPGSILFYQFWTRFYERIFIGVKCKVLTEWPAKWAIVYFGQRFENHRRSEHFCAASLHGTNHVLILTEKRLGYILGATFSQTHPVTLGFKMVSSGLYCINPRIWSIIFRNFKSRVVYFSPTLQKI
jgi:hypothetical protein